LRVVPQRDVEGDPVARVASVPVLSEVADLNVGRVSVVRVHSAKPTALDVDSLVGLREDRAHGGNDWCCRLVRGTCHSDRSPESNVFRASGIGPSFALAQN
jgi:hypothetical protein